MSVAYFKHVKVTGVKTSLPANFVDIDDELEYFDNNPKKLNRQKRMIGFGRRYYVDGQTSVVDLAVDAARKLMSEKKIVPNEVEAILFVNQTPEYPAPADACLAHGQLNLRYGIPAMDIRLGCSGYVYALFTAYSMIESGAIKNCLLLCGDVPTIYSIKENRKSAPVFGDAASASFIERTESESSSAFVLGSDGTGWEKLIKPFGGTRLQFRKEDFDLKVNDPLGNPWDPTQTMMAGEEVFAFTMEVSPKLILDTMAAAGWSNDDVGLFAIHQANKQILEMIISKAGIPEEKTPIDVFSKYANNSTNSVVTVLCDQAKPFGKTILCTFGIGLSWGGAALDLTGCYNGGISTYHSPADRPTRQQQIEHWVNRVKNS